MQGKLVLKDGTQISGLSFGKEKSIAGEVVFSTGMVGYPESLTDPSYAGQILVMTYPLIGNYGVPSKEHWESGKIQVAGLIVSSYIDTPSHYQSEKSLGQWLKDEGIPALEIKDTRGLTQKLRAKGVLLGKIELGSKTGFIDPNRENLVARVSTKEIYEINNSDKSTGNGQKTVVLLDCGAKENIANELVKRGVKVIVAPWNCNPLEAGLKFDGLMISNGPGDPKMAKATITTVKEVLAKKIPTFGICLGNQILALAAGGDTYKLKFGHRGQNQPAVLANTDKCYLTTQNHGFAVGKIPRGFKEWFYNANDQTNEGIRHEKLPFMSVQFHPESRPGPLDTGWLFDEFIKKL
ncbi:MAG: glutamine-hydrolyzing carbamoyl-phosphate synthase small subunit [Patescibacteria group bacterium]|jgi:carbamoyl-phosphate synthase small subunit